MASHPLGAAAAAGGAGWIRDVRGSYDLAFYLAAGLCAVASGLCLLIGLSRGLGTTTRRVGVTAGQ